MGAADFEGTHSLAEPSATAATRFRANRWVQVGSSLLLGSVGLALVFVAWVLAVRVGHLGPLQLPAPGKTAHALWFALTQPVSSPRSLVYQSLPTLQVTLEGFFFATAGGFLLGFLLFEWRFLAQLFWPLVIAFQALPKVAMAPLLVIWFGPGIHSKVILVAIVAFFPVFINTIVGLESLDQDTEEMLRSYGARRWKMLLYGRFPASLPVLFAGMEAGLLTSLVAVVVAEFVAAQRGLGWMITQAQYNLDIPTEFALLIVFAVIGLVLLEIVTLIEHRVIFWKDSRRGIFAYVGGHSDTKGDWS